jgi:hypothetical protein
MKPVMINLRKGVSGGSSKGGGIARGSWISIRNFVYHALRVRLKAGRDSPLDALTILAPDS